jgi:hypothetical protein
MPELLAAQEVEILRIVVQDQSREKVKETTSQ